MSLFSAIVGGIKAVGNWAGEKLSNSGVSVFEAIGDKLQDICSGHSRQVGETPEYYKESAGISTTAQMQEILSSFSTGFYQEARELENKCITAVEGYFDEILQVLQEQSREIQEGVNIRRISSTRKQIKKVIRGAVTDPLAKRMSLDDRECLEILRISAGSEKKERMQVFSHQIIEEALDNLADNVRDALDKQNDEVTEFLTGYLEEQMLTTKNMSEQFAQLEAQNTGEEQDTSAMLQEAWQKVGSARIVLDQLEVR